MSLAKTLLHYLLVLKARCSGLEAHTTQDSVRQADRRLQDAAACPQERVGRERGPSALTVRVWVTLAGSPGRPLFLPMSVIYS